MFFLSTLHKKTKYEQTAFRALVLKHNVQFLTLFVFFFFWNVVGKSFEFQMLTKRINV